MISAYQKQLVLHPIVHESLFDQGRPDKILCKLPEFQETKLSILLQQRIKTEQVLRTNLGITSSLTEVS